MTQRQITTAAIGGKRRAMQGEAFAFLQDAATEPGSTCIIWPFTKDKLGYGRVWHHGRMRPAHRIAWEVYHRREMDAGLDACHEPLTCHNRACVNPLHIRAATRFENMADTVLDQSDIRGEKSVRAKLTADEVLAIRADPRSHQIIAQAFSVSRDTVNSIKLRRRWAWLADDFQGEAP